MKQDCKHKLEFIDDIKEKDDLIECRKCGKRWFHDSTVYI